MSVEACAQLVARADPDRFLATMAAPVQQRADLFALYAFNIEVSRAPYVTKEPLIAEMRLQWWLDALEEIAAGGLVRAHEVTLPLAQTVQRHGLNRMQLQAMVQARKADIHGTGFADLPAFWRYLDDATGGLMLLAGQTMGGAESENPEGLQSFARADAIARYLRAIERLSAQGRPALPPDLETKALAQMGCEAIAGARKLGIAKAHRPAAWAGWWVADYLRRAAAGRPTARSPAMHKAGLLWRRISWRF